jgi:hypothetical protein
MITRTYVGADSNPVTPSRPMQIPLKTDLAMLLGPEGLACQFSTRIWFPVFAQCTTEVTTKIRMVKHCTTIRNKHEMDCYGSCRLLTAYMECADPKRDITALADTEE